MIEVGSLPDLDTAARIILAFMGRISIYGLVGVAFVVSVIAFNLSIPMVARFIAIVSNNAEARRIHALGRAGLGWDDDQWHAPENEED